MDIYYPHTTQYSLTGKYVVQSSSVPEPGDDGQGRGRQQQQEEYSQPGHFVGDPVDRNFHS